MSGRRLSTVVAAAMLLTGCAGARTAPVEPAAQATPAVAREDGWQRIATTADRDRLRNWRATWLTALAEARAADPAAIAREPTLFAADAALPRALPPVGAYRCRTFKLGRQGTTGLGFVAYGWFACRIADDGGALRFEKVTGSQRPVGQIFADTQARGIFLGTLMLGDETRALRYGRDASRDLIGIVERIGERRWRIGFPAPRFESKLDVIELVPAG